MISVVPQSSSPVLLFATSWTVACQAPLSKGFPREEYWNGLRFPSPRILLNPGIEPTSPALAGGVFTAELPGKPCFLLAFTDIIVIISNHRFECNSSYMSVGMTYSVSHSDLELVNANSEI